MESLLITILAIPLIVAGIVWITPGNVKVTGSLHILGSIIYSLVALVTIYSVSNGDVLFIFNDMLFLDSVGGVFLSLIAVTGLLINIYSVKYMEWELEKGSLTEKDIKLFFSLSHIFIFTMSLSVIANNMAIMWAAVEATTLSSVFMVAIHSGKRSTESGWKYIVICSVGLHLLYMQQYFYTVLVFLP